MRILILLSLLTALAAIPRLAETQIDARAAGNPVVSVRLSALDDSGAPATLALSDLRLLEDGTEQELQTMGRESTQRLSLALLIDNSASMKRSLPVVRKISGWAIDKVLRPGRDLASVVSFSSVPTVEQELTTDTVKLHEAVDRAVDGRNSAVGPSTSAFDALSFVCRGLLDAAPGDSRRAVLLVSDCEDTSSGTPHRAALQAAIQSDVRIYAVCIITVMTKAGVIDHSTGPIREITRLSGGRAYFPNEHSELIRMFGRMTAALNTEYVIKYESKGNKSSNPYRRIEIELLNKELRNRRTELLYPRLRSSMNQK
jgi:Ca-activated chloride channel family protein